MLNVKLTLQTPSWFNQTRSTLALICLVTLGFIIDLPAYGASGIGSNEYRSDQPVVQLGIGDSVGIQVYGQADMSVTVYVADDGTLSVPLVGPVKVKGL